MMEAMKRAKECRNEYYREWRRQHKDRVKVYNQTYWQRRAERQKAGAARASGQEEGETDNV